MTGVQTCALPILPPPPPRLVPDVADEDDDEADGIMVVGRGEEAWLVSGLDG